MAFIELESVDNVRDLGGIPVAGGRMVKPGLLFRGGALHCATEHDRATLFSQLGIDCVVDLRCGWERDEKPDAASEGVANLHIPFYDLEIVGIEYTEPAAGTEVVGRDVACDPDRFYRSLANPLTVNQMRQAAHAIFDRACTGHPVYQHCSGGKDRSGIMALVLLSVLGASHEAIAEDYLLTNISRDGNYDKTLQRFLKFTGDEDRARELVFSHRARPENLEAFYEAIGESYGDMECFMREQLGFNDDERAAIRERCTIDA